MNDAHSAKHSKWEFAHVCTRIFEDLQTRQPDACKDRGELMTAFGLFSSKLAKDDAILWAGCMHEGEMSRRKCPQEE